MKLSRSSWHYQLLRRTGYYDWHFTQANLCWYFWQVMATLFIIFLAVLLSPLWIPVVGLIFLGCWWYGKWEDKEMERRKAAGLTWNEPWPKKPSLIRAWFKAKKDKVCPIIEWED